MDRHSSTDRSRQHKRKHSRSAKRNQSSSSSPDSRENIAKDCKKRKHQKEECNLSTERKKLKKHKHHKRSSSSSSSKRSKKKSKRKKKYRSSSSSSSSSSDSSSSDSSSSDSSSTSSEDERKKKQKRKTPKAKKKHKKKKKRHKKKTINRGDLRSMPEMQSQQDIMVGPLPPAAADTTSGSRSLKPMTKEEWEKQQSITRRVYDPETGRNRLIKGDGEIVEEIVSKDRHREINKQATMGDGLSFQHRMGLNKQS